MRMGYCTVLPFNYCATEDVVWNRPACSIEPCIAAACARLLGGRSVQLRSFTVAPSSLIIFFWSRIVTVSCKFSSRFSNSAFRCCRSTGPKIFREFTWPNWEHLSCFVQSAAAVSQYWADFQNNWRWDQKFAENDSFFPSKHLVSSRPSNGFWRSLLKCLFWSLK